ncbi:MAG: hypothetical protein CTY34_13265 [Methylobacter sp.]|nr:MAG: hypothetical protein CTY34_13265 [Methylobacter sp.]PPD05692.1 MAG: hypothetical protein CTY29_00535 [Methylobacter sp.]PPD19174.1 MAG: hypothetical protein CTY24_11560 [Methylobacter sp.]
MADSLSISGVANAALALQQQKLTEQVGTAVLVKAKDISKQEGEAALQLLEAAKVPKQGIDVRV